LALTKTAAFVAVAALVWSVPVAAQDRCRNFGLPPKGLGTLVAMGPTGLVAVTVCIAAGGGANAPEVEVLVDGQVVLSRAYEGNCGTVSGRLIQVRSKVDMHTVSVRYCVDQMSLRPGG
jgi:hypothetical protein